MIRYLKKRLGRYPFGGGRTFDRLRRAWPQQHRFDSAHRRTWVRFANRLAHRHLGGCINRWLDAKRSPRR